VDFTAYNPHKTEGITDRLGQQSHWLRGVDLNHRPLGYELVGKLQIQLLCGADDNPRSRMNTVRHEHGDPCLTWVTKLKENLEPFARGLYVNQTSDRGNFASC